MEALRRVRAIARGDRKDATFEKGGTLGRLELLGQPANRIVMPIDDQQPASDLFQADRVADGDAVKGAKSAMTVGQLPRVIQDNFGWIECPVYLSAINYIGVFHGRGAMVHRRSREVADDRMMTSHRDECQAASGARRRDIVESALSVPVFAAGSPVPAAVQNDHIVELQTLRPVC